MFRKPGSQWALAEAKKNLLSKYLLVGVTENLEEFLIVLEATVPSMFRNLAKDFHESNFCITFTLYTSSRIFIALEQLKL